MASTRSAVRYFKKKPGPSPAVARNGKAFTGWGTAQANGGVTGPGTRARAPFGKAVAETFVAHDQIFGTSTLHLPDFHCPDRKGKYYGPTGPA